MTVVGTTICTMWPLRAGTLAYRSGRKSAGTASGAAASVATVGAGSGDVVLSAICHRAAVMAITIAAAATSQES